MTKEADMTTFTRIIIGLFLGAAGFFEIPYNPGAGCGALFVSGLLILAGMEELWSEKDSGEESSSMSVQLR